MTKTMANTVSVSNSCRWFPDISNYFQPTLQLPRHMPTATPLNPGLKEDLTDMTSHDSRDFLSLSSTKSRTPRLHETRENVTWICFFLEMLPVENLVLEKAPQRPGQINRASYCNNLADSTHIQSRSCWIWSAWHLQKGTYPLEKLRSRPLAQAKLQHKLCPAKHDN